jgi:hypothetical protein
MTDQILLARLRPALRQMCHYRTLKGCAIGLAVAALIAAAMLPSAKGLSDASNEFYALARFFLLPCGILLGLLGALAGRYSKPGAMEVAKQLEKKYPDLEGRLITALEQVPDEGGRYRFLQEHLFCETLHHSTQRDWKSVVNISALRRAKAALGVSFVIFVCLWAMMPVPASASWRRFARSESGAEGVTVTPGDTELEKGSSLVLLARFEGVAPGVADLITGETAASEKRVPLTRNMSDPVFGGTVADVKEPLTYRIAWDGGESRKFKVRVFEYPKLERSDVTLTYPEYTKQAVKHIEDMRHTSAVEGTKIDLDLVLNKPVASAVLEPHKTKGAKEDEPALAPLKLETFSDKPAAALRGFVPAKSGRYDLVLTDADGRQSRQKVPFSFDVVPNKVPELKLATPKGDQKPSALQELLFSGTVWDDFGVVASGLEVTTPGGETVTLDFSKDVPGRETRSFQQMLRFEDLKAVQDQLFAWHIWADDIGPDGKVRRTKGDLFYGEIRAFEEIFRQGDGMESEQQQRQQQQQKGQNQQQGPAGQLAEGQKQIINAIWKLQRGAANVTTQLTADIETVRDSQKDAITQATEAAMKAGEDPYTASGWKLVLQEMEKSANQLEKATTAPGDLGAAVPPAQGAYQALLKLRAHEYEVSRKKKQQQQQGGGGQQGGNEGNQRQQEQLDQLDLAKQEDRYETQREAQAQQSAERREQMQIMNRLKELAQRQQDVNEKLKELQTALNEAKTEQEKEEARRKLKRLEDEQRRMLADADELGQKMEQRQNQSEAGEQRQKLDEARENMEQAAEATSKGEAGKALASGTRAQQQMDEMREQMRKQSAGAFSDELRQMRAEARDIARKQEDIAKQLNPNQPAEPDAAEKPEQKEAPSLGGGPEEEDLTNALDKQEERTEDLVKRATELSEQAEPSEPLLSRQIYETARQYAQDDTGAVKQTQQEMLKDGRLSESQFDDMRRLQESEKSGKALKLTSQMLRRNQKQEAARTGQLAREGLDRLRQGVEKAAESVIGDDTEAIRLAESQLQAAADAVQKEIEQQAQNGGEPQEGKEPQPGGDKAGQATAKNQREKQPGEGSKPGGQEGEKPNDGQPGGQQPNGERPGEGQGQVAQNQNQPKGGQQQGNGRGQRAQQGNNPQNRQPGEQQQPRENGELAQEQNAQPQEGQQGQQPGEGGQQPGKGQQAGRGQDGQGNQTGETQDGARTANNRNNRQRRTEASNGGGGGGGPEFDLETRRARLSTASPLTGNGFNNWSDSLREAEEMVDQADLRNGIAAARERARQMRFDMKKDALKKPDWAVVQLEVLKPLVEVRQRLREELARRDSDKAMVPVDRDPVPAQFSENVRRYYEQLGRDQ